VKLFVAGKITGFFGLKGYMKIQPSSEDLDRMTALRDVYVGTAESSAAAHTVEDVILRQNGVFVKLSGVDDRTAAERLRNCLLFVEESKVKKPPKGEFFVHDIVGCEVRDADGALIGTVEDVRKYPAQDLWEVRTPTGMFLLPAVKEFVRAVDVKKRVITVRLLEGLREGQSGGERA
jgi:16S rRNA processing protein RimM